MGKPSKGTPADKRLKSNKQGKPGANGVKGSVKGQGRFSGKRAAPFAKGGGRRK